MAGRHPERDHSAGNLPVALTSIIGREAEKAEIKRLLSTTRLVTLTGAGGAGKTRLALQVASEVVEHFSDGVWLVELGPLFDAALVPSTVAATLGVVEQAEEPILTTLKRYLRERCLLLILDNCEHLIGASAELTDTLLRACRDILGPRYQPRIAQHRRGNRLARSLALRARPGRASFGRASSSLRGLVFPEGLEAALKVHLSAALSGEIAGRAVQSSEARKPKSDAASSDLVQSGAAGYLVGRAGLEPATLGLRVPCTASCANGPEPF